MHVIGEVHCMISILVSMVRVVVRTNLLSKHMFHIHLDDCVFWSCWVECPVGWHPHFCHLLPSSEEERGGKTSYFCFDIFYWSPYSVNISQSWRLWISGVLVRKEASGVVLRKERECLKTFLTTLWILLLFACRKSTSGKLVWTHPLSRSPSMQKLQIERHKRSLSFVLVSLF